MKTNIELVKESLYKDIVKVSTHSGFEGFTKSEVEEEFKEKNSSSDGLYGWINRALIMMPVFPMPKKKSKALIKKIIDGIFKDIIKGKIKKIEFKKGSDGSLNGFKNLDISKYY